jgi:hypothetical protein
MRFERVLKECRRRYVTRLSLPRATIFDDGAEINQGWPAIRWARKGGVG